jgi:DNA-binding CsgD family transcriptional regulator
VRCAFRKLASVLLVNGPTSGIWYYVVGVWAAIFRWAKKRHRSILAPLDERSVEALPAVEQIRNGPAHEKNADDEVPDDSPPLPRPPATEATTEPPPQRHVLPKNLRKAVKHLSDEELDSLHAATLEEMKRRGRLPPSVSAQSSRHPSGLPTKRLPPRDKIFHRRHTEIPEDSLTRGQVNVIRSAFRAGITPARIARQFGISQSNVRKALAGDEPKR